MTYRRAYFTKRVGVNREAFGPRVIPIVILCSGFSNEDMTIGRGQLRVRIFEGLTRGSRLLVYGNVPHLRRELQLLYLVVGIGRSLALGVRFKVQSKGLSALTKASNTRIDCCAIFSEFSITSRLPGRVVVIRATRRVLIRCLSALAIILRV